MIMLLLFHTYRGRMIVVQHRAVINTLWWDWRVKWVWDFSFIALWLTLSKISAAQFLVAMSSTANVLRFTIILLFFHTDTDRGRIIHCITSCCCKYVVNGPTCQSSFKLSLHYSAIDPVEMNDQHGSHLLHVLRTWVDENNWECIRMPSAQEDFFNWTTWIYNWWKWRLQIKSKVGCVIRMSCVYDCTCRP